MNIAICDDDLIYMNKIKEMTEKWGKLLISIENTYLDQPEFRDGIPISKEKIMDLVVKVLFIL